VRRELPRLDRLTGRVLAAHGDRDPRLQEVRRVFLTMMAELESHLEKEEQVLFPIIRELEATGGSSVAPDSLEGPLTRLESEHQDAGSDLAFLRAATDEFTPPEGACNTWMVMLDSLNAFERDMHEHVHKENNVLFPRALELQRQLRQHAISSEPA
jgi:regulator of cell morphogenesis and NO signaling